MNFSEKLSLSHQDVCENKVITNTLYDVILGGWITIDDYEFMNGWRTTFGKGYEEASSWFR